MADLEYISSAGLRGILGLVKSIKAASGRLAFCSLQPMAAEVFRISGFNAMLTVCGPARKLSARCGADGVRIPSKEVSLAPDSSPCQS